MANTTFNPSDKSTRITLSGSNLIATNNFGISQASVRAVDRQVTGKFYWEYTYTTVTNGSSCGGVATQTWDINTTPVSGTGIPGSTGLSQSGNIYAAGSATLSVDGGNVTINFGAITSGTVVCIAVDLTARLVWYRVGAGGNWNNNASRNPATGVGGVYVHSIGVGIPLYPIVSCGTLNDQITANFGDTAFTGAVPSGYTSGFTAGTSVPTNAIASQALAEHWLTTNPQAQVTQVVAEHWASVASGNLQAVVTQVMLEHWMSVAVVVPAAGGPMVTMIH